MQGASRVLQLVHRSDRWGSDIGTTFGRLGSESLVAVYGFAHDVRYKTQASPAPSKHFPDCSKVPNIVIIPQHPYSIYLPITNFPLNKAPIPQVQI